MKSLRSALALFTLVALSTTANAASFTPDSHTAYRGDFDGDGLYDLYLKPENKFIIIAADIVIPLPIAPQISHTLLTNNGNGTYTASYNLSASTIATLETWTNNSHNVITGDFTGDGHVDILLQAKTLGHDSIVVEAPALAGGTPTFLETLTVDSFNFDIASDSGATITVSDVNSDGKQDLVINRPSQPVFNALAQTNNLFSINPVNIPAVPQAPSLASIPNPSPASDEVGTMAGNFRVDESGSATYNIPILTVPGSGGVAPQVSLNYSSQGGNGPVGLGWSIGGLSGITRCRQTYEQDSINKAISLTSTDRFCLDGQRLVSVSGVYGEHGTEYRTEIESNAKIFSYGGNSTTGPSYFIVKRKDGTSSEYGNTSDSRLLANGSKAGVHLSWLLNEIKDSSVNGNAIDFSYTTHATGETLIDTIDYSQNSHQLAFTYGSRTDTSKGYLVGSERQQTKRLTKITSYADSTSVRTYDLTYQNSAAHGLSQVTQIEECNGSVCYDPTVFAWSDIAAGFSTTPATTTILDDSIGAKPGDFNGDGLQDLVWVEKSGTNNHWYAHFSHGTNASGFDESAAQALVSAGRIIRIDSNAIDKWYVLDYNNDGYDDFMYAVDDWWYVRLSTGSLPDHGPTAAININVSASVSSVSIADLNGDGLSDMAWNNGSGINVRYLTKTGSTYAFGTTQSIVVVMPATYTYDNVSASVQPGNIIDVNGDGNVDILAHLIFEQEDENSSTTAYFPYWGVLTHNPSTNKFEIYYRYQDSAIVDESFVFADFNGDGLVDFLQKDTGTNFKCFLNKGDGYSSCGTLALGATSHDEIFFGDYDMDGNADAFYAVTGGGVDRREWNPSTNTFGSGTSTGMSGFVSTEAAKDYQRMFADINGDGRVDYLTHYVAEVNAQAKQRVYYANSAFDESKVITKVTNGLGAETDITYNALLDPTKSSLYTKHSDASSKNWGNNSNVFDVKAPMYVVSHVASSAPTAASSTAKSAVEYRYEGGKLQAGGRGFLGFNKVTSKDLQTNIETTTTYRQDFPFTGMPAETIVKSGSIEISKATNTLLNNQASCGAGSTNRPFVSSSVELQRDLADGSLMTTVTTSTTQDGCGNVLTLNVATQDGPKSDAANQVYNTNTTNTYHNLAGMVDIFYGRLDTTTVNHVRGGVTQTTKSKFNYDGPSGILYQEIIEPDNASLILTTTYGLDNYGNRISVNSGGRTSTSVYDAGGRYVTQQKDHNGNVVSTVLARNNLGQPTQIRDAANVVSDIRYGDLGRKYFQRAPDGSSSHTVLSECPCTDAPSGTVYQAVTTTAGGPTSRVHYDVLGRELRAATQGFDGRYVAVDTEYDNLGRVSKKSDPYYLNEQDYWTTFAYDTLGRVTLVTHPDSSTTQTIYHGVVDNSIHTINGLNQNHYERKNSLGETLKVIDHLGGQVSYVYDPRGNLKETHAPGGAVTTIAYDGRSRKTSMTDPDKGTWTYTYNIFGELLTQTDADGNSSEVTYDNLGRMVTRIDKDNGVIVGESNWSYGNNGGVPTELGKLINENIVIGTGKSTQDLARNFYYDSLGRPSSVQTTIENEGTFDQSTKYDQFGRVFQQFDAASFNAGTQYDYNSNGYQYRSIEAANSSQETHVYHEILAMDARGQVTSESRGGITSTRTYDNQTGRIDSIYTNGGVLQNLTYSFDVLGNLTARNDYTFTNNVTETFLYDGLNRLTQASGAAHQLNITYDAAGNITSKSNMQSGATYVYGAGNAGPHAVTSVGGTTYTYDNNGNMTSGMGRTIGYTTFNKPNSITNGTRSTSFLYGPNRARFKRNDSGDASLTTLYIGNVERIAKPNGIVETKRYIGSTNIVTTTANNPTPIEVIVLTDHLGSTNRLVNRATGISENLSYDAFGLRRGVDGSTYSFTQLYGFNNNTTKRGFTGHEHLDGLGLVHMNGRVYDPLLGRFISADPVIDGVKTTQGFNRYSYVHNNPLSFTDPTGFSRWVEFRDQVLKPVAAITAAVLTFNWAMAAQTLVGATTTTASFAGGVASTTTSAIYANGAIAAGIQAGAAAGFVSGGILTGSIKGAVRSAFSGALSGGLNGHLGNTWNIRRVATTSISGGISSHIQGGKFKDGFMLGLTTSMLTLANYKMRAAMIKQSAKNPHNLGKESAGFFGDNIALAGSRRVLSMLGLNPFDPNNYGPCVGDTGGCQGAWVNQGDQHSHMFGIRYHKGGILDSLAESFAGPHDWFSDRINMYDEYGNLHHRVGLTKLAFDAGSAALIPVAAPFSVGALVGVSPASVNTLSHHGARQE